MQAPTSRALAHFTVSTVPACVQAWLCNLQFLLHIAGGRVSSRPVPKKLVIEVREFMSSLPSVLHQQGLHIVPVTLEVPPVISFVTCLLLQHN